MKQLEAGDRAVNRIDEWFATRRWNTWASWCRSAEHTRRHCGSPGRAFDGIAWAVVPRRCWMSTALRSATLAVGGALAWVEEARA